jgi:thiamine biosynthesis lipoprotein
LKIKWLIYTGLVISFWGCNRQNDSYLELKGEAQGSTFSIRYQAVEPKTYETEVDSIFLGIDNSLSLWQDNSLISRFNAEKDSLTIDPFFKEVYIRSRYFYQLSNGAFDPTVGPITKAWGFSGKNDKCFPSDKIIDSLKQLIGFEKITLEGDLLSKQDSRIQLDFNALAQGYTVDVVARFLESRGIKNYLIEIGGEILAKGKNEKGEDWRVGIERPDLNEGDDINGLHSVIRLSDAALATSGSYRKFIEKDGKIYSHTIDPLTGKPVNHSVLSVSVIAPTAMDADAYATVFMVLGEEKALELAKKRGLPIQIISSKDGSLSVIQSSGFAGLIDQK